MTEKSIYLKMSFNMFKILIKFLFLHIILLFIYLLLLFFIFYYIYIVIKIAPDFCHEYRNDMQFPSFWVKIFFYDFLKIVILTFSPFLLSMPQLCTSPQKFLYRHAQKLISEFYTLILSDI